MLAALLLAWTATPALAGAYALHRDVAYSTAPALSADVYVPEGAGPFPGVLVIHGGGWSSGKRSHMDRISRRLAKRGYAAVNISYRLAPKHLFPDQVHDCKAAVRWMRANAAAYKIDPGRIGAFGYSAGAHLAAMLGVTDPAHGLEGPAATGSPSARVQAVVGGGAPTDLRKWWPDSPYVKRFLGPSNSGDLANWEKASPIVYVSSDDPPMFLYHGKWDRLVGPDQTLDMRAALAAAGVPHDIYLIRGMGHVQAFLFSRSAVSRAIDFLDKRLK